MRKSIASRATVLRRVASYGSMPIAYDIGDERSYQPRPCRWPSDASTGKRSTSMTLRRSLRLSFPESRSCRNAWRSHHSSYAATARGRRDRFDHDSPHGSSSVHRQADRASQNLRRPGGDRHRERAAVQRDSGAQRGIARGAGASDGDGRGARHHQPLADGRAAGARRHRRERGAGLRDR